MYVCIKFAMTNAGKSTNRKTKAPANLLMPVRIYPFNLVSCLTELTSTRLNMLKTKINH